MPARAKAPYRSAYVLAAGDAHLAEDLVQEALGRVYVHWNRVAGADNPAAYAQTVLVRTFLSLRRRRSSAERPFVSMPEQRGLRLGRRTAAHPGGCPRRTSALRPGGASPRAPGHSAGCVRRSATACPTWFRTDP
ncbi:sigma factor [Streptomyces sp. NPDC002587]